MAHDSKSDYLQIPAVEGEIYVVAGKDDDEEVGEVIIGGNPEGLRSLGKILSAMVDIDQSLIDSLPENESEHIHLRAGIHIGEGELATHNLIISRLDMKSGKLKEYYKSNRPGQREILEMRIIKN